jgi:hypothetical protein
MKMVLIHVEFADKIDYKGDVIYKSQYSFEEIVIKTSCQY